MTNPFYSTSAWRILRYQCLRRDNWRCTCCGASVRQKNMSRVDHIEPRDKRPDLALVLSNLRTLCASCDNRRHAEKGGNRVERPAIAADGYPETWR